MSWGWVITIIIAVGVIGTFGIPTIFILLASQRKR